MHVVELMLCFCLYFYIFNSDVFEQCFYKLLVSTLLVALF